MDRLKTIESFVHVARMHSFSEAAAHLGVTRGLISKHISALERDLGVRLLNRSSRDVTLTEIGGHYFEFCQKMVLNIATIESEISQLQNEPLGSLSIATPMSFGSTHLADAVAQFSLQYPKITVALKLDGDATDSLHSSRSDFDVALRLLPPAGDSAFAARRLGTLRWIVCAAPTYLNKYGEPSKPADLSHHKCLNHLRLTPDRIWRFSNSGTVKVSGAFLSNSDLAIRQAAIAGVGIAQLPTYYVGEALRSGTLRQVLTTFPLKERPVYALFATRRQMPRKVKLFVDFLAGWFRRAPWEAPQKR